MGQLWEHEYLWKVRVHRVIFTGQRAEDIGPSYDDDSSRFTLSAANSPNSITLSQMEGREGRDRKGATWIEGNRKEKFSP
ncbi:hypothetical protein HZH66_001330 [Vespula vulgaris]|uniref:Uncharacterized protein n=1 Tax=Vespula vulgaris TaxID=7454 RepID=A0A834KQW2_VESVU|nr:hypothetical protein HZH66_001330 [Vespula vulgaris]